ncbi:MAG: radical SAM protein [Candidatus Buchananbacteria bacterium]|nr:radical SAM protein [Candidatus Buchananbacteria bacterium]
MKEKRLEIFITFKCNNDCLFCVEKTNKDKYKGKQIFRDKQHIEEELNKYRKQGYTYLNLLGGEPFLAKDFSTILQTSKSLGFVVALATNASVLSSEKIAEQYLPYIDELIVSIHGHNKLLINQISQNPNLYDKLIKGLNNIKKYFKGRLLKANCVINNLNHKYLLDILKFINKFNIKEVNLTYMDIDKYCQNYVVKMEDLRPLIKPLVDYSEQQNMVLRFSELPYCVLGDYYYLANDLYFQNRDKYFVDGKKDKVYFWKKYKGKVCQDCNVTDICKGLNKDYYKLYGDKELIAFQ